MVAAGFDLAAGLYDAMTDDDRALAAEYTLGLLSDADSAAFEERLSAEPQLRDQYLIWAETLSPMVSDSDFPAPTAVKARLNKTLFGERTPIAQLIRWVVGATLGAAAAAGLVLLYTTTLEPILTEPDMLRAEINGDSGMSVVATIDTSTGQFLAERSSSAPLVGRSHEVWLIVGSQAPVSLGLLGVGGRLHVALPQAVVDLANGARIAVSDEPSGGSPTGAPTGTVLASEVLALL